MLRRWMVTVVLLAGVAMAGAGSFVQARQADPAEQAFEAARKVEVIDRDLRGAIAKYRDVVTRYASNRAVAANALVRLAACYQQLGQPEATATYQRVVRDFADQPAAVAAARAAMNAARPATTAQTGIVRRVVYEDTEWNAAAVSPDGKHVVGRAVNTQPLMLRTLPAKDDRVLFREADGSGILDPVFSPNGTMVAFLWIEHQGNVRSTSIGVVGTSPNAALRRITPGVAVSGGYAGWWPRASPIAWSADGLSVIVRTSEFSSEGRRTASTLDWVSVASGTTTKSIPFSVQSGSPAMSPNGEYFAYEKPTSTTGPANESRIYTIDSLGRNETEVVRIAGRHRSPVWTSDGSAILFLSNRSGREGLWAVRVQNGQAASEEVLVQDSLANGDGIAGVTVDGTVYLRQTQAARQHVFIAERGVPGARGLRAYNGGNVSWSPDGESVAFVKRGGTGQNNSLVIKNVATGEERSFDHPGGLGPWQVRWSRDGASILVVIGESALHIFDVRSGQFRPIPNAAGRVRAHEVADISPDGKTVYVASRPAGGTTPRAPFTEIVSVDVATGAERKLADLDALGHYGAFGLSPAIAVSPDGQNIAVQVRLAPPPLPPVVTVRLALVATDGSGSRVLAGPYRIDNIHAITWTSDGQSVLFFTGSAQQSMWRLMRVSVGGGAPVFDGLESATLQNDSSLPRLAVVPPMSLTVSPDGSRVAFGANAGASSQLVALENVNAVIARAR